MDIEMCEIDPTLTSDLWKEDKMKTSLKVLTSIAKRPQVDIEFQDLTYRVDDGKKEILKSISGVFQTGKLTAILGPSGAGKSCLLNVLVGQSTMGVTGNVLVNGKPRDMRQFHKLSCYIMQENLMQECITVEEAMNIVAELKLGVELKSKDKLLVVDEILTTLGLDTCRDVRTENLSGGQRKRLSLAMELVNNPPIIFLDEPTTGLDIVSMNQCINLLKHLAHCGRTIICTIHQSSASVLSIFDKIYVLADGKCVYQGCPQNLVPFMENSGFDCPVTHNPADFIIETVQINYSNLEKLSTMIENGNKCENISEDENKNVSPLINKDVSLGKKIEDTNFTSSFYTQFRVILKRMMLQKSRNKTSLKIQFINHSIAAFLIGGLFYNIGNDAEAHGANFKFCLCVMVFFSYTYVLTPVLLFPDEFNLLRREYYNRWYSLNAYYAALTICNFLPMTIFGTMLSAVTYYMTGQPFEVIRFIQFAMTGNLVGYCSEGFGLSIGSVFNIRNGSIVAPTLATPLMGLCLYGLGYSRNIGLGMRFLMSLSYFRLSIVALTLTLYENRTQLDCPNLPYCHYSYPKIILRDLGMGESSYAIHMSGILIFTIFYRVLAYCCLRYRLQIEFSNILFKHVSRYVRYKRDTT